MDEVHAEPALRRFWRKGRLVPNRKYAHPYQVDVPEEYKNVDRWFLLDTSLDPKRPWKLDTQLPVLALARVMGTAPECEWLVYAHAPLDLKKGVQVMIPEHGPVKIDVPPSGTFCHVVEKTGTATPVGRGKD